MTYTLLDRQTELKEMIATLESDIALMRRDEFGRKTDRQEHYEAALEKAKAELDRLTQTD